MNLIKFKSKRLILALGIAVVIVAVATTVTITMKADINKELSYEETHALYNEGYGMLDIQKAHEISLKTGKNIKELLEMKGKTIDLVNADADQAAGNVNELKVNKDVKSNKGKADEKAKAPGKKSWEEIEKELGVYIESDWVNNGITDENKDELTYYGFDQRQISEISQIIKSYGFSYSDVKEEIKNSTYIYEINEKLLDKCISSKDVTEKEQIKNNYLIAKANIEKDQKSQNNITNEDENVFNNKGIKDITDMVFIKKDAVKNRKTIDKACDDLIDNRSKIKNSSDLKGGQANE